MNWYQQERFQQLLIRLALIVVPTIIIDYVTLRFLNFSYSSLDTGILSQTIYFSFGLALAFSLYYYGARWIVSFVLLWLTYLLFERIINRLPGEFEPVTQGLRKLRSDLVPDEQLFLDRRSRIRALSGGN